MAASIQNRLRIFIKRPVVRSALLTAIGGILLVSFFPLENLSYDVCTRLKPEVTNTNVAFIYVDSGSPDRIYYAQLLDKLTDAGVQLVLMDVLFPSNSTPASDQALAQAIARNNRVILVQSFHRDRQGLSVVTDPDEFGPIPLFATAAKGKIGHEKLEGHTVREIPTDYQLTNGKFARGNASRGASEEFIPSVDWVGAVNLKTNLMADGPNKDRWLNYYGAPGTDFFPSRPLQAALSGNVPPDFLKTEIVVIGQNLPNGTADTFMDMFDTPYSLFGLGQMPGPLIHATALENLIHHEWLTRIPKPWQWLGAVFWAVIVVSLLHALSRRSNFILITATVAAAAALCALSFFLQWHVHVWWAWMGPALVQTPLALQLVMRNPKPDRYLAFISYRVEEDGAMAQLIARSLRDHGLKAFIDVRSLHAGKFDEQLLQEIESATYFVLMLSPNSLARCANEGDWVLRELTHALTHRKKIIPVMKSGFHFDAPTVPNLPQIAELRNYHGVVYSNSDFDGFMEKLRVLLK